MKSHKLLRIVLGIFLLTYPFSISGAEDGHDHGTKKKKASATKDDEGHDDHGHDDHGEEKDPHGHEEGEEGVIQLSQESQQLGGINTWPLQSKSLSTKIVVVGKVAQDPEETIYVTSDRDGIIKECAVTLGATVKKGDVLCRVVLSKDKSEIDITAPSQGTIIAQLSKPNDKVDLAKPIFALANLNKVGVNFDVYEKDVAQVAMGQDVLIYSKAYPEKFFKGKVVFVSPRMDEVSNTLRIKVLANNDGQALKLGMNVRGDLIGGDSEVKYLTVPTKSLQTVENKTVVFIKTSRDKFEAKEVKIISQDQRRTAIEGDVKAGQQVVVAGSFILKSKLMESEMEHSHSH